MAARPQKYSGKPQPLGFAAPIPVLAAASDEPVLHVLDMGLDFKSYVAFVGEDGAPLLGNVISFPWCKVSDVFEPTVGLLITVLHMYYRAPHIRAQKNWLTVYETLQHVFTQEATAGAESVKYAADALRAISAGPDSNLTDKLLIFLDAQSGMRGQQAPSQRKVPKEPKGVLCNLHLADKCNQGFSCNQLHLHQTNNIKHRQDFFARLVDVLQRKGLSEGETIHRLKDSIFYAKYGNRVTVRYQRSSVHFFKTSYSPGRLDHALRRGPPDDIILADERNTTFTKPLDLPDAEEVARELEKEAEQFLRRERPRPPALAPTKSPSCSFEASSPTTQGWPMLSATTCSRLARNLEQRTPPSCSNLRGPSAPISLPHPTASHRF